MIKYCEADLNVGNTATEKLIITDVTLIEPPFQKNQYKLRFKVGTPKGLVQV